MNNERAKEIQRALKALAKGDSRFSINETRVIVALERSIARLECHRDIAEHLVFKGGFVLLKMFDGHRFTRDADALAISIPKERIRALIPEALSVDLDDGLWFGDFQTLDIEEQGNYGAFRFDFAFQIGKPDFKKIHKLSRVHIDVGFSDRLPMKPGQDKMPSLLKGGKPVSWMIYPKEFIAAEKLETLFSRGSASSRAKDVCDLIDLLPQCRDKIKLMEAIEQTFKNRNTLKPTSWVKKAQGFDKTILTAAWPGVALQMEDQRTFKTAWNQFIELLHFIFDL